MAQTNNLHVKAWVDPPAAGFNQNMSISPILRQFFESAVLCISAATLLVELTLCQVAYAQSEARDTFTLSLKNVDIYALIETVTLHTGKNFIVDPRVKATVTVISAQPLDGDKLYEMFLSVLDVHGFAAVQAGSFIKIVPATVGVQSAVPVFTEDEQENSENELVTEVILVKYVPAQQMIEALRPLLPSTASFSAEVNSNTLIITDRVANIARLVRVIRLLDVPH